MFCLPSGRQTHTVFKDIFLYRVETRTENHPPPGDDCSGLCIAGVIAPTCKSHNKFTRQTAATVRRHGSDARSNNIRGISVRAVVVSVGFYVFSLPAVHLLLKTTWLSKHCRVSVEASGILAALFQLWRHVSSRFSALLHCS